MFHYYRKIMQTMTKHLGFGGAFRMGDNYFSLSAVEAAKARRILAACI